MFLKFIVKIKIKKVFDVYRNTSFLVSDTKSYKISDINFISEKNICHYEDC